MKFRGDDTIAAIATPPGSGALAIIRLSGPHAFTVADKVFKGRTRLQDARAFTIHYGKATDENGHVIDDVLASVFRAPRSYTGEDTVELSCHGGVLTTRRILLALQHAGARQAGPGEFTRRAFLNGKMDLTQAEAVADLIATTSERGQTVSLSQLDGALGKKINGIKSDLVDLCALLELELDFSEEGVELLPKSKICERIEYAIQETERLIFSHQSGRIYRDGVSVAIVGRPNVGKSSLFNALLLSDRAIVTEIPGTTRDMLEESIRINGVLFRLMDTAGMRESKDPVESEGIRRSSRVLETADIVALVTDGPDRDYVEALVKPKQTQRLLVVRNKVDIAPPQHDEPMDVSVSAKTGEGMYMLKAKLSGLVEMNPNPTDTIVTDARHAECLTRAKSSLERALVGVHSGASNEFIALDVKEAAQALSEITGEVTTEEILNRIFSQFCIGK